MNIAINGFGRIGRVFFRIAFARGMKIVAINDVHGPEDAAYLLKYDSTYGKYNKSVIVSGNNLIVDGKKIRVLSEREPEKLPWKEMNVDVVIESTGVFRDRAGVMKHLIAGAKRVIITAPADDKPDITVVPGVNHKDLKANHKILSVASCTTNCLVPLAKVLHDNFEIKRALMTTVHAYTNDQSLHDESHKKPRRGRAAAMNLIPTTTGADSAIIEVLPELKGKINGLAIRAPVHCGSLVDLVAELKKEFDVEKINASLKKASEGYLKGIMEYSKDNLVSSDVIGNQHSCVIDSLCTQKNGNLVKVLAWYDNEFGYSNRVADVVAMLKKW